MLTQKVKSYRVSFDFAQNPQLLELIRLQAIKDRTSQKAVLMNALEAYFAHRQESSFLLNAAETIFAEWDNKEDAVYDTL